MTQLSVLTKSLQWSRSWLLVSVLPGLSSVCLHCELDILIRAELSAWKFSLFGKTHTYPSQTALLNLDLTHAHHVEEQIKAFVLFMECDRLFPFLYLASGAATCQAKWVPACSLWVAGP